MGRLSISLLGPFRAALGGAPVTEFESDKVRALLAYLAVESGRPHRRQSLAGLLWPEWPEAAARANLRNALAKLRQSIRDHEADPPYLLAAGETIQFNLQSDHWLDVRAFAETIQDPQSDVQALEKALALYRGDFLEGFALEESASFEEWQSLTREHLREQLLRGLARLVALYEGAGEAGLAAERARRWAELSPLDEEAHRAVMRLLARGGQRAAALAQYETCKRTLQAELGVEPAPETTALWEAIRGGEVASARARQARPPNLPGALFPLVGRGQELAGIAERLRDPACRLLTVVGPGGAGKTRLAVEAGLRAAGEWEHGLCYVPLSGVREVEGIVPAIAQGLRLDFLADITVSPKEQVLNYLRGRQVLLLLDSYEHLLEGAGLVAEILAAAPGAKVLATSRAPLGLPGEVLYPLAGLAHSPEPGEGAAAKLFWTAARRAGWEREPTPEDAAAVEGLCRRVGGLPLAVLLAATWMRTLSPAEIAAELAQEAGRSLELLTADWPGVPERERSMRAVFDRSWELLSARERAILAGLSVFRGGFTAHRAEAVTGATLRDLARLVDRSLVMRRESGRYDLQDLTREYAAARLAETPEVEAAARDRHAAHYARALHEWEPLLMTGQETATLREMEAEVGNIRAAWHWAVERGQAEWLRQGTYGLFQFYYRAYRWEEAEGLGGAAVQRLRGLVAERGREPGLLLALAECTKDLCGIAGWLRKEERVHELGRESLELLEEAERAGADVRATKYLFAAVGGVWINERWDEEKLARLREGAEQARAVGDRQEAALGLYRVGMRLLLMQREPEARGPLQESLALYRELGYRNGIQAALLRLVMLARLDGRFGDLEEFADEGEGLLRGHDHLSLLPRRQVSLCAALYVAGRFASAEPLTRACVADAEETALSRLTESLTRLGAIEIHLGRWGEARETLTRALRTWKEGWYRTLQWSPVMRLSLLALAAEDLAEVQRCLEQGQALLSEVKEEPSLWDAVGDIATRWLPWLPQAVLALLAGHPDQAGAPLRTLLRQFTTGESLAVAALYGLARGEPERAVELYAVARRDPFVSGSSWYARVVGERVAAAAAGLPPEAVRAAEERGRKREWAATIKELVDELAT
ncbi:MAG: hypothetical protein GXY76_02915 [Chloroflexi bacterium]|nr:hypothetical protein [Chloroflexota bacterium]